MGTRRIDFHEEYLIIARRTCRRRGKIHLLWRQVIHFRCGYLARDRAENISAYPVYGLNCPSESALSVTHGDGNMTLQLEVIKVDTRKEQTADITTIRLKDKVYPFYMNLCYRTYPDADIIETWTEITHEEKKRSPSIVSLPLICRSGKETYGFPTYTAHGQTRLNWHKNRYDRASR